MFRSHDNERCFFDVSISSYRPLYLNGTLHNIDLANPVKSEDFISHRQSSYSISDSNYASFLAGSVGLVFQLWLDPTFDNTKTYDAECFVIQ
jgi:hypothetical protein